jgi:hypothetical protein
MYSSVMGQSFTKLFSSITDSTIWREPDNVRIVWITMLASADAKGRVFASIPGLADKSRVTLEACIAALDKLSSPDEWSRTKTDEGRRLEVIDGGWRLINYTKYRELRDEESVKASKREWWNKNRGKLDASLEPLDHTRSHSTQEEAEAEADKKENSKTTPASRAARGSRLPIDWEPGSEEREFAIKEGISGDVLNTVARTFVDYWISQPGAKGVKLNWSATWRNWCRNTKKPFAKPELSGAVPVYKFEDRPPESAEQRSRAREVLAEAKRRIKNG